MAANTLSPATESSWSDRLRVAVVNHHLASVMELFEIDVQVQIDIVDIVDGLCREAIAQARPDDIICALISKLPPHNRLDLFADKSVIPSPVVRANDVELANFYVANGFEPQIAPLDVQYAQQEIEDFVFSYQFPKQLTTTNANPDFWERLDSSHSAHHHDHDHGAHEHGVDELEYEVAGNFKLAQDAIRSAIDTVFNNLKSGAPNASDNAADDIFLLYAFIKAQDQGAPIPGFVMPERRQFERIFNITNGGQTIGDVTCAIPDGKAYLVKRFALDSFSAKYRVIGESSNASYKEKIDAAGTCCSKFPLVAQKNITWGLDVADLSVEIFFNNVAKIAKNVYQYMPSFLTGVLAVGAVAMLLRAADDQKNANIVRDNIGALTEAFSFFVLVNGVLDNLFHSTALIAPSCALIATYDKVIRPTALTAYNQCNASQRSDKGTTETNDVLEMVEQGLEPELVTGSYNNFDAKKLLKSLEGIKEYFDQDAMWTGLRKAQLAYETNHLETTLKSDINRLIKELGEFVTPTMPAPAIPKDINQLLQVECKQTLKDIGEMMQAYVEVCEKKNPGTGIKERFQSFCECFARDGILLADASDDAVWAAFCMRHEAGLVTWDDRIKASFPELPTARELLLAAGVIGVFLAAIQIYKAATGSDKEPISSYLLDFPTHLFKWLHLNQLYDNLGGGAASTEWFKKFFAIFNLTENSSHFYIAAVPIINYIRHGSKMFEDLHHGPTNWLAYLDQRATGGAMRKRMVAAPTEARAPNALPTAADLQAGAGVPVAV